MKHWETHPVYVDGCDPCKWASIGMSTAKISQERKGKGPMGDEGTRKYVEKMYADRRRDGYADPVPTNKESARFAPAAGVIRDKKYKEINGGL